MTTFPEEPGINRRGFIKALALMAAAAAAGGGAATLLQKPGESAITAIEPALGPPPSPCRRLASPPYPAPATIAT